jgi:hypothetical protein
MRLILSAVVVLVVSIVVAFFITPRQVNQPSEVYNVVEEKIEDREEIVARFQKAIALATVSDINANNNHVADDQMDAFNAFLSWVQSAYPLVFQHLKVEKVQLRFDQALSFRSILSIPLLSPFTSYPFLSSLLSHPIHSSPLSFPPPFSLTPHAYTYTRRSTTSLFSSHGKERTPPFVHFSSSPIMTWSQQQLTLTTGPTLPFPPT